MPNERSKFGTARYYSSVIALQVVTLLFGVYMFSPWLLPAPAAPLVIAAQPPPPPPEIKVTKGAPVRIVVPRLGLDLQVDEGLYNSDDQTWTLSGLNAHFAAISQPANDYTGSTFIYGHNNKNVFGPLTALKPGDLVHVHTKNHLVFTYIYESARDTKPDDVSSLSYEGRPILTLQTCSGSFNEWRRMYRFGFDSVREL